MTPQSLLRLAMEDPGEMGYRHALADLYEERSQPLAASFWRWAANSRRHPYHRTVWDEVPLNPVEEVFPWRWIDTTRLRSYLYPGSTELNTLPTPMVRWCPGQINHFVSGGGFSSRLASPHEAGYSQYYRTEMLAWTAAWLAWRTIDDDSRKRLLLEDRR